MTNNAPENNAAKAAPSKTASKTSGKNPDKTKVKTQSKSQGFRRYRFALLGLKESGKTTLLTTFAMSRQPNALGFSGDLLDSNQLAAYYQGRDDVTAAVALVQENRKLLLKQEALPPTSVGEATTYPVIFSDADGAMLIELVDYSGELMDPDRDADVFKRLLRQHLTEVDGLVILAPVITGQAYEFQHEVDLLKRSFQSIADERRHRHGKDTPAVILLNKWDAYTSIDYQDAANEQQKLLAFLRQDPLPPHQGLRQAVENALGKENVQVLPVSALGPCEPKTFTYQSDAGEKETVVYVPKDSKSLKSFQLEDGFVWLARRRDALQVEEYQARLGKSWPYLPNPWPLFSAQSRLLKNLYREKSEKGQTVAKILQQRDRLYAKRLISTIIAAFILLVAAESTWDYRQWQRFQQTLKSPNFTVADYEKIENWLLAHLSSPVYRHALLKWTDLPVAEAEIQLQALRSSHRANSASQLWQQLQVSSDWLEKVRLATDYQRLFADLPLPENLDADKTPVAILAQEQARKVQEIALWAAVEREADVYQQAVKAQDYIERVPFYREQEAKANALIREANAKKIKDDAAWETVRVAVNAEDKGKAAKAYLAQFPQGLHRDEARALVTEAAIKADWQSFQREIQVLMEKNRWLEAAKRLAVRPDNSLVRPFKADFRDQAFRHYQRYIDELSAQPLTAKVSATIKKNVDEYQQFPPDLRPAEAVDWLNAQAKKILGWEDQALYAQCLDLALENPERLRYCDQYLTLAPLKTMIQTVQAHRDYLAGQISGNVTFSVQGKWSYNSKDGNDRLYYQINNRRESTYSSSHAFAASGRLGQPLSIAVSLENPGAWFGDKFKGSGTAILTIGEGASDSIRFPRGDSLIITLIDFPTVPAMPVWQAPPAESEQ